MSSIMLHSTMPLSSAADHHHGAVGWCCNFAIFARRVGGQLRMPWLPPPLTVTQKGKFGLVWTVKMKTTLLASTALVLSVGAAAAADFTLADTGHDHASPCRATRAWVSSMHEWLLMDLEFTSRARVEFTGAGETDGGLGFGFSFRAGDAAPQPTEPPVLSSSAKAATRLPWATLTRLQKRLSATFRASADWSG